MHIIIGILFAAFYIHAAHQSKKMQSIAAQPAGMVFLIFSAKTLLVILSILVQLLAMTAIARSDVIIFIFRAFSVLHWILFMALICAVLGWRKLTWMDQKKPLLFAMIALALEMISVLAPKMVFDAYMTAYTMASIARAMPLFSIVTATLGFLAYGLLLKAIFAWRGYPAEVKLIPSLPAATVAPAASSAQAQPREVTSAPKGMFDEVDYVPYICGVMLLGGLVAVPMIWGSASRAGYLESIIPSLVSCALFAFAHDKRGNFNLGRFALMFFYVLFMMMRSSSQYGARGGAGHFFLAGGLLGYFVMFLCGWAGIKLGRLYRRS